MTKSYVIYSATPTGDLFIGTVKSLDEAKRLCKELNDMSEKMGGSNLITFRAMII